MYDGGYLETDSLDARVLSMEYTPQKFSTDDLVAAWKDGSLKINEEYQRGAEWTEAQAQGLIDSIFRKYPIPPIFLHQIHSKGLGGLESTRYEIVDGQQRIRALADLTFRQVPAPGSVGQETQASKQSPKSTSAVGQAPVLRSGRPVAK